MHNHGSALDKPMDRTHLSMYSWNLVKPEGGRETEGRMKRSGGGGEEVEKIFIVGKHRRPSRTTAETRVNDRLFSGVERSLRWKVVTCT